MKISRRIRRISRLMNRYVDRCEKITKGKHVIYGYEKRYYWLIRQEYMKLAKSIGKR